MFCVFRLFVLGVGWRFKGFDCLTFSSIVWFPFNSRDFDCDKNFDLTIFLSFHFTIYLRCESISFENELGFIRQFMIVTFLLLT